MPFSPGSLTSTGKARRTAREFASLIGEVVNATVSQAPIAFVEIDDASDFAGFISHAPNRVPAALPLEDGRYLYLLQRLCLRRKERYLTTLEYRYAYQATSDAESWIVRWEYQREPEEEDYAYPLAHLHVSSSPGTYAGSKPFSELHLPTGRVTVEDICRHLVEEHRVGPISEGWRGTLSRAETDFKEIQRKRFAEPA